MMKTSCGAQGMNKYNSDPQVAHILLGKSDGAKGLFKTLASVELEAGY